MFNKDTRLCISNDKFSMTIRFHLFSKEWCPIFLHKYNFPFCRQDVVIWWEKCFFQYIWIPVKKCDLHLYEFLHVHLMCSTIISSYARLVMNFPKSYYSMFSKNGSLIFYHELAPLLKIGGVTWWWNIIVRECKEYFPISLLNTLQHAPRYQWQFADVYFW